MRPLLLEIEGLQSYEERQVIDFEKLCQNGLFGIFGETGSGKSTILDAMILALYAEIPRGAEISGEKNSIKNFLNISSKKLEVYFKFALDENIYEITRKYALGKSKGEDILNEKVTLLIRNGELLADSKTKLAKVIADDFGLSMDDFTRTVVLPQGKFSEFVKLKGSDKRAMLENIFNMERYGKNLQIKIKREADRWKQKDEELNVELEELENVTPEGIELLEKEKVLKEDEVKRKQQEQQEIESRYHELKTLKEEIDKYNQYLEKQRALENQKADIEYIQEKLNRGKNANEIKKYIDESEKIQKEESNLVKELQELELKKLSLNSQIEKLEKNIEIQKIEISQKEKEKSQIYFDKSEEDILNEVIRYRGNLQYERKNLENDLKELEASKKEGENCTQELAHNLETLDLKKKELEETPNISREILDKYRDKIEEYQRVIRDYKEKSSLKLSYLEKLEDLERKLVKLSDEEKEIDNELESLEEKRKENLAYELAKNLKEGEACPVCGSVHHIKVEHNSCEDIEKIQKDLKIVNERKSKNIAEIGKLQGSITSFKESIKNLDVVYEERVIDEIFYQDLVAKKIELESNYLSEQQKLTELEEKRKEINNSIIQLNEKCKNLQSEKEKLNNKIENLQIKVSGYRENIERLEVLINNLGKEFVLIEMEELEAKKDILKRNYENIQKYESEIVSLKRDIESRTTQIVKIKEKLETIKIDINGCQVKISTLNSREKEINEQIEGLLNKHHFTTLDEVRDSYISEAEERNYTQRIESYEISCRDIATLLNDSRNRVEGKEFSSEIWEEVLTLKEEIKDEVLNTYKRIEQLSSEINLQKAKLNEFKEKKELQKEIRKKRSMVEDLNKKFTKGRFLNFLTTKKLKGIIENASYYINKITNGKYRLYSDNECDFYVIDMFNDGVKRRVATLSGGEVFIVSLCLALALSKQLQLKGKTPLEFFFLDEGFGSLDSRLLDKVMEAIEGIRREENINIGIITHLEDLKVRIDKKLQVERAIPGERGTRVRII